MMNAWLRSTAWSLRYSERGQIFKNLVLAKVSGMSRALAYFREGAVCTEHHAHL